MDIWLRLGHTKLFSLWNITIFFIESNFAKAWNISSLKQAPTMQISKNQNNRDCWWGFKNLRECLRIRFFPLNMLCPLVQFPAIFFPLPCIRFKGSFYAPGGPVSLCSPFCQAVSLGLTCGWQSMPVREALSTLLSPFFCVKCPPPPCLSPPGV